MSTVNAKLSNKRKSIFVNLALVIIVIALAVVPLIIAQNAEFGGADGEAESIILEINAEYEPWFSQIWAPPSGEIESMLFALQAAIGSGVLFYCLGYLKGRSKKKETNN